MNEVQWIRCPPWNKDMKKEDDATGENAVNYDLHMGSKDD